MPQPDSAVTSRLLDSAAAELHDVIRLVPDPAITSRIEHVRSLVGWVRTELDRDPTSTAELAATITRLAHDDVSDAQLSAAIHALLGYGESSVDESTEAPSEHPVSDRVVTAADVTEYLRTRSAGKQDEAHSVRTIHGGFSKRTLLVSATIDGHLQEIVLRQVPAGRQARSLAPEFELLRNVHGSGFPAPEPLWIEPTDNILGGAFFVTRRAPGANFGDVWGGDGVTKELCLQIAELYAQLHTLDTDSAAAPVSPRSTPTELEAMIAWQESTLDKRGIPVEPVLGALLRWLRAHIPPAPPRRSLIHGDAAFSNLLIEDGRVSAVLDWEAAHYGDPAEELAYLRPPIEPVLPWSDFVDAYVAAGGTAPNPAALDFFEVWSHVWRHIGCLWMAQNYDVSGRYSAAVAAYVHGPRFLSAAVDAAFGPRPTTPGESRAHGS